MNISATLNGQSVRIVNLNADGNETFVWYVDNSNNLNVIRGILPMSWSAPVISATIALSASGS